MPFLQLSYGKTLVCMFKIYKKERQENILGMMRFNFIKKNVLIFKPMAYSLGSTNNSRLCSVIQVNITGLIISWK
jgi:hypothetical protein